MLSAQVVDSCAYKGGLSAALVTLPYDMLSSMHLTFMISAAYLSDAAVCTEKVLFLYTHPFVVRIAFTVYQASVEGLRAGTALIESTFSEHILKTFLVPWTRWVSSRPHTDKLLLLGKRCGHLLHLLFQSEKFLDLFRQWLKLVEPLLD